MSERAGLPVERERAMAVFAAAFHRWGASATPNKLPAMSATWVAPT